jgi:uncharacterized membrane protein
MNDELIRVLILLSAVGCGLVGGIFFAFSTFVMKALDRLPSMQGISAMQSINVVVINPMFLSVFFGTAVLCAILSIFSLLRWYAHSGGYLIFGSLFYLLGTILVTMVCNVPRNNMLATVDPASDEGNRVWRDYVKMWTKWNHVRTVAALMAAVLLSIELYQ